jgi:hypothetical protein
VKAHETPMTAGPLSVWSRPACDGSNPELDIVAYAFALA